MTEDEKDIGDYLHVPPSKRLDVDPEPELNDDAGFDVTQVPDGDIIDPGDGAPETVLAPDDPEHERTDD